MATSAIMANHAHLFQRLGQAGLVAEAHSGSIQKAAVSSKPTFNPATNAKGTVENSGEVITDSEWQLRMSLVEEISKIKQEQ